MKLFVLILSLFSALSVMAQVGEDPNDKIAKDGNIRQGVFLDAVHKISLDSYGVASEPACPGCGDVSLISDNTAASRSGSGSTSTEGQQGDSLGQ